jgi:hypothetical protein
MSTYYRRKKEGEQQWRRQPQKNLKKKYLKRMVKNAITHTPMNVSLPRHLF